jgi:hypothetical protein
MTSVGSGVNAGASGRCTKMRQTKKLEEVGGTSPRSVRFPDEIWKLIEARAKKKGLSLHAALRKAILDWIERAA